MNKTIFIANRQKLLFIVQELHQRGFGLVRVFPSMSPSGVFWRCSFFSEITNTKFSPIQWLLQYENKYLPNEIGLSVEELTDLFMQDNKDFINPLKGKNQDYEMWYSSMLANLDKDEIPYAMADWKIPDGYWETFNGKHIKTLPNEKDMFLRIL